MTGQPNWVRGEPGPIQLWMGDWRAPRVLLYAAVTVAGTAAQTLAEALAAHPALRVERGTQEHQVRHAGDFDRILETEEKTSGGTLMRLHAEQDFAVERHRSFGHFISGSS